MIRVITGHICAGKSTHVRERARPSDVVIDFDRIALAISPEGAQHHEYTPHVHEIARAARWCAIEAAVLKHRGGGFDVWIIHAYPEARDLATYARIGATMQAIEAPASVLRARALAERPSRARDTLERMLTTSPH